MNPITNSNIKEGFRQANEANARSKENVIRQNANARLSQMKKKHSDLGCLMFIFFPVWIYEYYYNKKIDEEVLKINNDASVQIRNLYAEADRITMQQIRQYENEVNTYHKKVLNNASTVKEMVDYVTTMFQRMVSHADTSAHKKFIETDFTYVVRKTGISFNYQSTYTNPQDDYNFEKQRFRDLHTDAECEGLAQALAIMTIKQMKSIYPPNSLSITVSHNDAAVTLHYKSANKNFVVARDIV